MTTPQAQAGEKNLFHLHNGDVVVEAGFRKLLVAWLVDTVVAWVVIAALVLGAIAATGPDALGGAILVFLPAGVFLYGMATGHRRSVGQKLVGTRTVRCADGSVPGFWRAGWVMVVRLVLVPFLLLFTLVALLGGDAGDVDGTQRHVSVDVRATERLRAQGTARTHGAFRAQGVAE